MPREEDSGFEFGDDAGASSGGEVAPDLRIEEQFGHAFAKRDGITGFDQDGFEIG